jgi:ribose/xylose/arabinose/galactoside ABC-type transport system permease subunit
MFLVYKNKGLLILLYLIVCLIGTAMLVGVMNRSVGGMFPKIDFYSTLGISLLFTVLWTYLTKDDFYKDRNGNKVKMDTPNEFFWISMKTWVRIFLVLAVLLLSNSLFHFLP